ncbi:MAG: flagellar biosynthesis protein FlhB [Lachnospirales bacterium]
MEEKEFDYVKFEKFNSLISLNLQFFEGEKTEEATSKKREKSRDEGQVAKSQDISTAILFIVGFFTLNLLSGYIYRNVQNIMVSSLSIIDEWDEIFVANYFNEYLASVAIDTAITVLPFMLVVLVVGVITSVVQVGWKVTGKPLKPKLNKLNPISGFKRIFSMRAIVELVKNIAKLSVILLVVYNVIKDDIIKIYLMFDYGLSNSVAIYGDLAIRMGISVGAVFMIIGIFDLIYQRWKHNKDLKMSKQEVKDEYKESEGNPEVKAKIRGKMREAAMRRMMQDLPTADVIITNPTHISIAIKYDRDEGGAPKVIGKGVDFLALRIREVAKENDIPIVENKPLARTIYANVDIDAEIPPDLYQAVAEILAYVYKLKNKI